MMLPVIKPDNGNIKLADAKIKFNNGDIELMISDLEFSNRKIKLNNTGLKLASAETKLKNSDLELPNATMELIGAGCKPVVTKVKLNNRNCNRDFNGRKMYKALMQMLVESINVNTTFIFSTQNGANVYPVKIFYAAAMFTAKQLSFIIISSKNKKTTAILK